MKYAGIFKIRLEKPMKLSVLLSKGNAMGILLLPGPFNIEVPTPNILYDGRSANMGFKKEIINFYDGCYLSIEINGPNHLDIGNFQEKSIMQIAKFISILDIIYPNLVEKRSYIGFIQTEDSFVYTPEYGYQKLYSQQFPPPKEIATSLIPVLKQIEELSIEKRNLFTLASRWFRKGYEATNPIDRYLFWYTVLEIYPSTQKSTDIPKDVALLIHDHIYPDKEIKEIKDKLIIGRICGERCNIVHHGKHVIKEDERKSYEDYLSRLEKICLCSLKILCGIDPGTELDEYFKEN